MMEYVDGLHCPVVDDTDWAWLGYAAEGVSLSQFPILREAQEAVACPPLCMSDVPLSRQPYKVGEGRGVWNGKW